jgi:ribosome-associated heat shock protein Hsp15
VNGSSADSASPRLDKWLWFARFCKTRALVQRLIKSGHVTVNGVKTRKVSAGVRVGDIVMVVLGPIQRTVTVRAVADRRGPAAEARGLYEESEPPRELHGLDVGVALHKFIRARPRGAGRPIKKERHAITKHIGERWDSV